MRHPRIGSPLVIAAFAALIFASSSAATVVTSPSGTAYTGVIKASNEGAVTIHGVVDITCNNATLEGTISSHGSGVTAKGPISSSTLTECNQHLVLISNGTFEYHTVTGGASTITSTGRTYTFIATTIFGNVHCSFMTLNSHYGVMTPGSPMGGTATFHTEGVIPIEPGSSDFLCGSSVEVTGRYKVTTPSSLSFD